MFRGPTGPHCVRRPEEGVFGPRRAGAPKIGSCLKGFHLFFGRKSYQRVIAAASPPSALNVGRRVAAGLPFF